MGTWMEGTWGWPRMRTWGPGWGDGGGGDTLGWGHLGMGTWMGETWGQQGLGTGGALWWRQRGAWTQGQGTNWDGGGHIGTSVTWGQGSGDTPPPPPHTPFQCCRRNRTPCCPLTSWRWAPHPPCAIPPPGPTPWMDSPLPGLWPLPSPVTAASPPGPPRPSSCPPPPLPTCAGRLLHSTPSGPASTPAATTTPRCPAPATP